MLTKICFASDLHLFSARSNAEEYVPKLKQTAQKADVFIFGGDIFDFKWSQYRTFEEGVVNAMDWLEAFANDCPGTQFKYLIGNHDCIESFVEALETLESKIDLRVEHYFLTYGKTLFLHGDVIDAGGTQVGLEACRRKWQRGKPKSKFRNSLYDLAIAWGLHRLAAERLSSPGRIFKKLNQYLVDIDEKSQVDRVVYGHTHWKNEFEKESIQFCNGGAAIKGLPFEPIVVQINEDAN